jgi:hypothetical protein
MSNISTQLAPSETPMFVCILEGSGMLEGQSTRAGDVWYLEAGVGKSEYSGDATFLKISSLSGIDNSANLGII